MKDLVVEPGKDPSTVELHFAGAQKVTFGDVGTLVIVKADGSIWRYKPSVYQMVDGKRRTLAVGFHFVGKDRVSLKSAEAQLVRAAGGGAGEWKETAIREHEGERRRIAGATDYRSEPRIQRSACFENARGKA